MGLFDFFRKNKKKETPKEETPKEETLKVEIPRAETPKVEIPKEETLKEETPKSELFLSISKYNEYILQFILLQREGNYAPISAYEKPNGEIVGFVFVGGKDDSYWISVEESIQRMESMFNKKLADNNIKSFVILYHSQFDDDNNHSIANKDSELKAITVSYKFKNGQIGKIGLPYLMDKDEITYQRIKNFTQEENDIIFKTELKKNKVYFEDREELTAPIIETEIGLKISKSNSSDLENTWCGIFGFESYRERHGSEILMEYFALALTNGHVQKYNNIAISELKYKDISLKAISVNGNPKTILPVIKTDYTIDVVNKEIIEWENIENLEAIIKGTGRNTFGITYFATDYPENREKYHSKKEHNIKISGIAFVLDIYKTENSEIEKTFSPDFTAYMPNNDLPGYACFDFIGQLEDFKETFFLDNNNQKGYLMNIRLITNSDMKDFFTIDIFVTSENMRFKKLTKGMKLTGMFQMQGQIAE